MLTNEWNLIKKILCAILQLVNLKLFQKVKIRANKTTNWERKLNFTECRLHVYWDVPICFPWPVNTTILSFPPGWLEASLPSPFSFRCCGPPSKTSSWVSFLFPQFPDSFVSASVFREDSNSLIYLGPFLSKRLSDFLSSLLNNRVTRQLREPSPCFIQSLTGGTVALAGEPRPGTAGLANPVLCSWAVCRACASPSQEDDDSTDDRQQTGCAYKQSL